MTRTKTQKHAYIAIGPNVWGKGNTPKLAVNRMTKANNNHVPQRYAVYEVEPTATVDEVSGGISYTRGGTPPKEVLRRDGRKYTGSLVGAR
jgi:hypothetical protein